MRPRVIVLGAGASSSYEDSPTGVRPPLAKEIFSAFHSLSISRNRFVLIGYIINYTRDTRGIDSIDFGAWDEDVELLLTEIDEKVQLLAQQQKTGKGNAETFSDLVKVQGAYNQLIFMFTSIFNEIQNGPVSIPYAILASELTSEDTLITFNWDALMDRALLSTNRWFPNDGYCIKPEYIFNDGWWEPPKFDYLKGGPKYIKLHGSTNWLMPYHGINLTTGELFTFNAYAMDKLYVFLKATHPYETYLNEQCA